MRSYEIDDVVFSHPTGAKSTPLETHDGRAPGAESGEKREPASDIDTGVVDSLKALDPEWPIREADVNRHRLPSSLPW